MDGGEHCDRLDGGHFAVVYYQKFADAEEDETYGHGDS